jgi:hypothetical protein
MLEMHDLAEAQQLSLSIHALAGTDSGDTIRLRAMVGDQMLLILVDSGSTGSFLNEAMLSRLHCKIQQTTPVTVKLANNATLSCDQWVPHLTWHLQGEQFHTPMRVLPLGAYDAILGVDWLKKHGPVIGTGFRRLYVLLIWASVSHFRVSKQRLPSQFESCQLNSW